MKVNTFDNDNYSQMRTEYQSDAPLWQARQECGRFDESFRSYQIYQVPTIQEIETIFISHVI